MRGPLARQNLVSAEGLKKDKWPEQMAEGSVELERL